MEVATGGHGKVLFEPQEPSFELSVQKTPEGGFRIVLAKVAHAESGFTLRASEPIVVSVPR